MASSSSERKSIWRRPWCGRQRASSSPYRSGSPALLIERTTYTEEDRPIEYVKSLYRGDRYRFSAMLFKRKARKGGLP